jgi:hypothetical protein
MHDIELQSLLTDTMRDVLEMSFFANILEEATSKALIATSPSMAARIMFSGAASGSFTLVAAPLAVHSMAMEFMGDSAEDREVEAIGGNPRNDQPTVADEEVFRELTNILCGSVLSRYQADRCCNLSQPVMCSEEMMEEQLMGSICAGMLLEEGLVTGYWKLDGQYE